MYIIENIAIKRANSDAENSDVVSKKPRKEESQNCKLRKLGSFNEYMRQTNLGEGLLTRCDLEQFSLQKICEAITYKTEIAEYNQDLKQLQTAISEIKKDLSLLIKHINDYEIILEEIKITLKGQNITQKPIVPLKITRCVGLQVKLNIEAEPKGVQGIVTPNAAETCLLTQAVQIESISHAVQKQKPTEPIIKTKIPEPTKTSPKRNNRRKWYKNNTSKNSLTLDHPELPQENVVLATETSNTAYYHEVEADKLPEPTKTSAKLNNRRKSNTINSKGSLTPDHPELPKENVVLATVTSNTACYHEVEDDKLMDPAEPTKTSAKRNNRRQSCKTNTSKTSLTPDNPELPTDNVTLTTATSNTAYYHEVGADKLPEPTKTSAKPNNRRKSTRINNSKASLTPDLRELSQENVVLASLEKTLLDNSEEVAAATHKLPQASHTKPALQEAQTATAPNVQPTTSKSTKTPSKPAIQQTPSPENHPELVKENVSMPETSSNEFTADAPILRRALQNLSMSEIKNSAKSLIQQKSFKTNTTRDNNQELPQENVLANTPPNTSSREFTANVDESQVLQARVVPQVRETLKSSIDGSKTPESIKFSVAVAVPVRRSSLDIVIDHTTNDERNGDGEYKCSNLKTQIPLTSMQEFTAEAPILRHLTQTREEPVVEESPSSFNKEQKTSQFTKPATKIILWPKSYKSSTSMNDIQPVLPQENIISAHLPLTRGFTAEAPILRQENLPELSNKQPKTIRIYASKPLITDSQLELLQKSVSLASDSSSWKITSEDSILRRVLQTGAEPQVEEAPISSNKRPETPELNKTLANPIKHWKSNTIKTSVTPNNYSEFPQENVELVTMYPQTSSLGVATKFPLKRPGVQLGDVSQSIKQAKIRELTSSDMNDAIPKIMPYISNKIETNNLGKTEKKKTNGQQNNKSDILAPRRHPAPLPPPPVAVISSSLKQLLPKPSLSLLKMHNGINLIWQMPYDLNNYEPIAFYQLYIYRETSAPPTSNMWKWIDDIKPLKLPMLCSLMTQVSLNEKYYFAVRPVDVYNRLGRFSDPQGIVL